MTELDAAKRMRQPLHFAPPRRAETGVLSPFESLSPAWHATLRLLLRPFVRRRWVALSVVCVFLGGGTSTAAFQWAFGALPLDLHISELLARTRLTAARHPSLILLAVVLTVGLGLALIYVRCVLRFVLIDAVIKQDVALGPAWKRFQSFGRSYFLWLLGVVGALLVAGFGVALVSIHYLAVIREAGCPGWVNSVLLATELLGVVLVGLLVATVITVTDDLVAPVMYCDGISLPAAWRTVWKMARRDSGTFLFYVVLRFAVSLAVSIGVLIVLFPVLMGLSAGALVSAALVILALRTVGVAWAWNPLSIFVGALALLIFTGLLFAVLSAVGMPGQVYLQNYGVRFIASRVPSLGTLCRTSAFLGRPMRRM
jgi:hypothetical protein